MLVCMKVGASFCQCDVCGVELSAAPPTNNSNMMPQKTTRERGTAGLLCTGLLLLLSREVYASVHSRFIDTISRDII